MRALDGSPYFSLLIFACFHVDPGNAWIEFCRDGDILTAAASDCPGGVLFKDPTTWRKCLTPHIDNGDRDHIANVCDPDMDVGLANKIQFIDVGMDDADGPSGDEYDSCKKQCSSDLIALTPSNTIHGSADDHSEEIIHENDGPEMPDVQNQTLRMFMYLTGHLIDENDGGPRFRLVELMKQSFNVTAAYVGEPYMREVLFEELSRAFLFLLRESDTGLIRDIGKGVYERLRIALDECQSLAKSENKIHYNGKVCQTTAKIRYFAKPNLRGVGNITARYQPDPGSYIWGKYDFVLDAAWLVMNFVHGHCYRVFRRTVNDHHLYQYAIERLWTKELIFRWKNPAKLKYEPYWDHVFRSNVKTSMRNLDAMVTSVYHSNPFVQRVRRPWFKMEDTEDLALPGPGSSDNNIRRRRKRQTKILAWCLQSTEERNEKLEQLRKLCS